MADKAWEPDDPMTLTGVVLPAADDASLREMAVCFIEEFLQDGWTAEQLRELFRNPYYQGPYLVWRAKGETFVHRVIDEVLRAWSPP